VRGGGVDLLILGAGGQVGREVVRAAERAGLGVAARSRQELDITRPGAIADALDEVRPSVVLNCAAYTAVDRAETEPRAAYAVNRDGAARVASACRQAAVPLIHLSTDYVFDGTAREPYPESAPAGPRNVYGDSKLAGERAVRETCEKHLVVRTSRVFGPRGSNFLVSILRLAAERDVLRLARDQRACPTAAEDVARAMVRMAKGALRPDFEAWGLYHYAGRGIASWLDLGEEILTRAHERNLVPPTRTEGVSSAELRRPARRPTYSALDCGRAQHVFGLEGRPWREAVERQIARRAARSNGWTNGGR